MDYTATYSPEDNKLRLTASARLEPELYARVKAAGFKWAPQQTIFVAPMWTPEREDLLLELAGEIEDEDTSLLDRAEDRAERFEDYSDKRREEADRAHDAVERICSGIPLGQPILVGHHSEKHARKDAERIDNGMRKAVRLWDTSKYWEQRAKACIRHAKYKERPDVRHRRIKGIEADKRRHERSKAEAEKMLQAWEHCATIEDTEKQRRFALAVANTMGGWLHLPRKEGDRPDFAHTPSAYDALTNAHPTLYAPRTVQDVIDAAKAHYPRIIADCDRWLQHIGNRITYERAMLGEDGGSAADKFEFAIGGRVLYRGSWCVILKVNKVGESVNSLTCTPPAGATWAKTWKIEAENVQEYKPPAEGDAEKVKKATALPPLCNYPGEGFEHMTEEEYKRTVPKWSDFPKIATLGATEKHGRHRVRQTRAKGEQYYETALVYLTDAKRKDPPAPEPKTDVALSFETHREPPKPRTEAPRQQDETAAKFEALREQAKAGVQVVTAEQLFPTPPDLARRMVEEAEIDPRHPCRLLEPSAGTGAIIDALPDTVTVHCVEVNNALCRRLNTMPKVFKVVEADFLTCNGDLGKFDTVLMNPPFANAQDIAHIKHAITFLKPGGRLVAICANGPRQNEQLRPMIEANGGTWEPLPADTFKESGTGVNTVLLTYDAPETETQYKDTLF